MAIHLQGLTLALALAIGTGVAASTLEGPIISSDRVVATYLVAVGLCLELLICHTCDARNQILLTNNRHISRNDQHSSCHLFSIEVHTSYNLTNLKELAQPSSSVLNRVSIKSIRLSQDWLLPSLLPLSNSTARRPDQRKNKDDEIRVSWIGRCSTKRAVFEWKLAMPQ
jgi:hypothetical protein